MSKAPVYDQSIIDHYAALWQRMTILPHRLSAVQLVAHKIIGYKERYRKLELLTGIPWFLIGCLHYREADCNFHCHLHNGDPLTKRTVQVPAGRPRGEPPFTWEESALDALTMRGLENVQSRNGGPGQWSLERFAYESEGYNGWGYWFKVEPATGERVTSAYLFGATNLHAKGKYVADHEYDPEAPETQIGVMAILQVLMQLDPSVSFGASQASVKTASQPAPSVSPLAPPATQVAPVPAPTPAPPLKPAPAPATAPSTPVQTPPSAPSAPAGARPLTPWAALVAGLSTLASQLGAAVDSLKPLMHDPKVAAVLVAVAVVAGGVILYEHWKKKVVPAIGTVAP